MERLAAIGDLPEAEMDRSSSMNGGQQDDQADDHGHEQLGEREATLVGDAGAAIAAVRGAQVALVLLGLM